MNKHIEEYPLILTAVHISEILMISKPTAYEIMEQSTFPLIRISRTKRVQKDAFFKWLSQQQAQAL
ncbi:DNA-binding protein [Bacillus sp. 1P06AnD]|uniref:DNA-binding protein n=1 Tax=Bacillus sp. 1P06AnD TaxID=3132208 RepID=UPI0039A0E787